MLNRQMMRWTSCLLIFSTLTGCMHFDKELHYLGDADLNYYKDQAATIDYPNVCTAPPDEVVSSTEPRTLRDRRKDEIWDMTLAEAISLCLSNSRIIRTRDPLLPQFTRSETLRSVYDPAIQETEVLFGRRGVEAALADFDAQFTTSTIWGRDEQVQNNLFSSGGLAPGNTLTQETAAFETSLNKQLAYGGSMTVAHEWFYAGRNIPGQLFPSNYTGNIRAEYRQPLWAASGPEYTRIAGPANPNFRGITGVSQGVVIARINNDITLTDFEASVHNMLKDVEDLYWELYLNYQTYRSLVVARESALKTWRDAEITDREGGLEGFDKSDVPLARDAYFARKADTELALNNIYAKETELRRMLGLPVADGRIIRPADEPARAELIPDWYISLTEALAGRVELRRQKWEIKSMELQYQAARSLTNPQLDFVSSYRVNGFGDRLFGEDDDDGVTQQGLASAYETLTQGNQTGWNLGFVFSMPLGFRSAHTQVKNYELRVAKGRAVLAAMELDIAHALSTAFQNIAANYAAAQSNLNRQMAAQERVEILEKQREAGVLKADLVLRAQASRAEAERAFYSSLVDYNKSITDFHYRKGTLLEHNNVSLAENQWSPAAYRDAYRRAWARSHAFQNDRLLKTEPPEFALPGKYAIELPTKSSQPKTIEARQDNAARLQPVPAIDPTLEPKSEPIIEPSDELQQPASQPQARAPLGSSLIGRVRFATQNPDAKRDGLSLTEEESVQESAWADTGDNSVEPVESLDIRFPDE